MPLKWTENCIRETFPTNGLSKFGAISLTGVRGWVGTFGFCNTRSIYTFALKKIRRLVIYWAQTSLEQQKCFSCVLSLTTQHKYLWQLSTCFYYVFKNENYCGGYWSVLQILELLGTIAALPDWRFSEPSIPSSIKTHLHCVTPPRLDLRSCFTFSVFVFTSWGSPLQSACSSTGWVSLRGAVCERLLCCEVAILEQEASHCHIPLAANAFFSLVRTSMGLGVRLSQHLHIIQKKSECLENRSGRHFKYWLNHPTR